MTVVDLQNCSVQSSNIILCYTVPGVGLNLVWSITYNGAVLTLGSGSFTTTMSYNPPVIYGVTSSAGAAGFDTIGGQTVTIDGAILAISLWRSYCFHVCFLCV